MLNYESVSEVVKKKIGRELREWVYLGVRTGMRRGIDEFKKTGDESIIKRVLDLPNRGNSRISYAVEQYGRQFIDECLSECGNTTLDDMLNDTQPFIDYCLTLKERKIGGESFDTIADELETQMDNERFKWIFPYPPNYKDIWGE